MESEKFDMNNIEQAVSNMSSRDLQSVFLGEAELESGADQIQNSVNKMSARDLSQVLLGEDGEESKPIEESQ